MRDAQRLDLATEAELVFSRSEVPQVRQQLDRLIVALRLLDRDEVLHLPPQYRLLAGELGQMLRPCVRGRALALGLLARSLLGRDELSLGGRTLFTLLRGN